MKRNLICLLLVSMLAAVPLWGQSAPPAGASQAFIAFTGGSVWNDDWASGTCIWYFPVIGDLPVASLFAPDPKTGMPSVDKEHAYFIWVSEWSIAWRYPNSGLGGMQGMKDSPVAIAGITKGTATIYYSPDPISRNWHKGMTASDWGTPVATFVRGAGIFQSPDGFQQTDRFMFSAKLLNSQDVTLGKRVFNFRSLMPHGMTCFEFGQNLSTTETGACIAMGN